MILRGYGKPCLTDISYYISKKKSRGFGKFVQFFQKKRGSAGGRGSKNLSEEHVFMKKRLHDKKAGIAILISLLIISLAETIIRGVENYVFALTDVGDPFAIAHLTRLV